MLKITVCCCTYRRPEGLAEVVESFHRQTYPAHLRRLVILDDAGQYPGPPRGAGWKIVSGPHRFLTLGGKRNACAGIAGDWPDALAIWDDDDKYLPHALEATAAALETAEWSRPSLVLHPSADWSTLTTHATGGLFHGGWGYRRQAFQAAGRYPSIDNGEDQALAAKLEKIGTTQADPIALGFAPFYIFPWGDSSPTLHLSHMGRRGYQRLAAAPRGQAVENFAPGWARDYTQIPTDPTPRPRKF